MQHWQGVAGGVDIYPDSFHLCQSFQKAQSENSLETFKLSNSTQVRSKDCFKTGLISTKQFRMFFYLESWMAGDILKTGNVINHLTSLQVFRLWPPSELGQILIKHLQTQLLFQRHKSSQVNRFFSLVCHKLPTKGISDIKAPCKQGIRRTYNSFWQKGNVFEPLFLFTLLLFSHIV